MPFFIVTCDPILRMCNCISVTGYALCICYSIYLILFSSQLLKHWLRYTVKLLILLTNILCSYDKLLLSLVFIKVRWKIYLNYMQQLYWSTIGCYKKYEGHIFYPWGVEMVWIDHIGTLQGWIKLWIWQIHCLWSM